MSYQDPNEGADRASVGILLLFLVLAALWYAMEAAEALRWF